MLVCFLQPCCPQMMALDGRPDQHLRPVGYPQRSRCASLTPSAQLKSLPLSVPGLLGRLWKPEASASLSLILLQWALCTTGETNHVRGFDFEIWSFPDATAAASEVRIILSRHGPLMPLNVPAPKIVACSHSSGFTRRKLTPQDCQKRPLMYESTNTTGDSMPRSELILMQSIIPLRQVNIGRNFI